ncbi:MAG: hypothetical protein BWY06_03522 [Candidatus Latescibacteria bacterium ADurb.Bin168]|nr:MAG: hypothetical protein BWY06_03522 [Candidatus Latescibacteria bacterium ADurb.Bin168]
MSGRYAFDKFVNYAAGHHDSLIDRTLTHLTGVVNELGGTSKDTAGEVKILLTHKDVGAIRRNCPRRRGRCNDQRSQEGRGDNHRNYRSL